MTTLNKPGPYDCLKKLQAHPDMPYFLILASDITAPHVVRDWAARAQVAGVDQAKISEALQDADDMQAWQDANPWQVKTPD